MTFAELSTNGHSRADSSALGRTTHLKHLRNAGSMLYFGDPGASPASIDVSEYRNDRSDLDDITVVESTICMWSQFARQFPVVIIDGRTVAMSTSETCRAVVHAAVQHLSPGGRLLASFAPHDHAVTRYDQMCAQFNLERLDHEIASHVSIVHRRTTQTTIHDLVFEARTRITRIEPDGLRAALDSRNPPTVVDTRTNTDRERFGVIRGSIHIPRTTLEWACDPSNGYRHPAIVSHDQPLVIVCNGGYSSSLAAANLTLLGYRAVNDLIGGHQAWVRAGHEVVRPDHTSLDF